MAQHIFKQGFMDLLRTGNYSDMVLVTPTKKFKVHRIILAFSSDFFETLLRSEFKESLDNVVELQLEDPRNVFPDIIKYMYSGKLEITLDRVVAYIALSDAYLVNKLNLMCKEFVAKNLKRSTALQLLVDAIELNQQEIVEQCLKVVASNFLHMQDVDFSQLEPLTFLTLLKHERLVRIAMFHLLIERR